MSLIVDGVDLDALNYTIKVPYNGTSMTGGDSLHGNLNIFYDVSLI
jgi:Amt family ammonium transporter